MAERIDRLVNRDLTRRNLGIALITPAAGLIIACGSEVQQQSPAKAAEPQSLPKPYTEPTAAPTVLPTATVLSRLDELKYPEVDLYRPRAQGKFRVGRSEITWINHSSDFNFFQDAAAAIFTYLSDFQTRLPRLTMTIEGTDFQLNLRQRPNIARKIYLIGQQHLMPSWWLNLPENKIAVTKTLGRGDGTEEAFSVVRVQKTIPIGSTAEIHLAMNTDPNGQFVIEAGQSTIAFVGADERSNDVAQEIFCNTLGIAYFLKQRGLSYQLFLTFVTGTKIPLPGLDNTFYYSLPSDEFQRLPVVKLFTS